MFSARLHGTRRTTSQGGLAQRNPPFRAAGYAFRFRALSCSNRGRLTRPTNAANRVASDRLRRRRALRPHSFQIVELAHLGSEHMHDHIAGIDQDPIAIGQALDVEALDSVFLEALGDVLRDRADMPVGPACGDDHVVGERGFAAKVDGDRFFRLHVVEAGEDQLEGLFGDGRLRDRFSRCLRRRFTRLG
jgi:hypothetical protein